MIATWQEIDAALTPIIGQRGVVALYNRSRHITSELHPWLASPNEGTRPFIDLASLESLLSQRGSAEAAAGGEALLQTFYQLLSSLIGPSLTERLLRDVWANASSGPFSGETGP